MTNPGSAAIAASAASPALAEKARKRSVASSYCISAAGCAAETGFPRRS